MAEVRCDCCDLPVSSCGRAVEQQQRRDAAARRAQLRDAGWTPAAWRGVCADCGEYFPAGTLIRAAGSGWKGECCA